VACAFQNMWLAAPAEGWVWAGSRCLIRGRSLAQLLGHAQRGKTGCGFVSGPVEAFYARAYAGRGRAGAIQALPKCYLDQGVVMKCRTHRLLSYETAKYSYRLGEQDRLKEEDEL